MGESMQERRHGAPSHGQALPLGLFLLFLSALVLYYMFNSGQAVSEKMRVTNAADAAAYSVGVQQARVLNYDAYANRAIVANEIAIAQMLSLQSWFHYFDSAIDHVGAINGYIGGYMGLDQDTLKALQYTLVLSGTAWADAYTKGQGSDQTVRALDAAGVGIIAAHNAAAVALAASQDVVHASMLVGVASTVLANDIVKAMDQDLSAQVILTSNGFDGFTKRYDGNDRQRLADVIMRSRDPFTADRSWTLDGGFRPFVKDNELKKRGGTELIGLDQWKAMDTLEGHGRNFGCGKLGLSWCKDIELELAWGGARSVEGASDVFGKFGGGAPHEGWLGGAYAENRDAAHQADRTMRNTPGFTGITASRDLADLSGDGADRTAVSVMVVKSSRDVKTTFGSARTKPAGTLNVFDAGGAGNQMAALSRAEVFFERPLPRGDGKLEHPSLYNPYWQARLTAPTSGDRAWAAAQQNLIFKP